MARVSDGEGEHEHRKAKDGCSSAGSRGCQTDNQNRTEEKKRETSRSCLTSRRSQARGFYMQTETIPDEYSTCRSEQERRNKRRTYTAGDRLHGIVCKEKRSSNTENFIESS